MCFLTVAWEWPKWAMAELGWLALWDGRNWGNKALCTKWPLVVHCSAAVSGLAWPVWDWPESGHLPRVTGLSVWWAERERERRRPRDESGNQRAGQRPPGQTIRGPLHYIYLNILTSNQLFVLSICVTFFTHLLMSSKEAVLWKDRTGLYCKRLQEISYQSLPWGAHSCKVSRKISCGKYFVTFLLYVLEHNQA